ncbi:hypothetical protein [Kitasatospora viridis]|uniref:Uncharacterized protein n=1 Tax=Kitasatospora viridis TaxID=281105 RepID=A0A561UDB2_9ACTN|nr:hypothetical protein [Kitasatospora viridis]TWF97360.1 hypothetical protein FHX73_111140 [Kitasatospora viridis]
MKITEAIHEILKANYTPSYPWEAEQPGFAERVSYQGEFTFAGQLRVHGAFNMSGLDAPEFFVLDDIADGVHDVYLAYDRDEEAGAFVTAVALVAGGTTPEALLGAEWADESDDVNHLTEGASAISSSTPNNWTVASALNDLAGEPIHADALARVAAEFAAQRAAGSQAPLLDVVVDPSNGANTLVFPTVDTMSTSILVGRDEDGAGIGIVWSDFQS